MNMRYLFIAAVGALLLSGPANCQTATAGRLRAGAAKVDITPNDCISHYIVTNFKYIGLRGDGAKMYKSHAGNIYARESSHWDITYF